MNWEKGTALKSLVKAPFTKEQLKEYAHASGDMNTIHLDDNFAKEAGFPSVIVHGMLSMAYLADGLRFNFPEKTYNVTRLKGRFRKVTFPGDTLTIEGEIKTVHPDGKLTVSLWANNQNGELTIDGDADVISI